LTLNGLKEDVVVIKGSQNAEALPKEYLAWSLLIETLIY
jgi:hypothetical protein